MKHLSFAAVIVVLFSTSTALMGITGGQQYIVPAGTIISCNISEKLSSQNTAMGDPVLCTIGHGRFNQVSLPTGSFLVGQFEAYKDPGHFVGKGWMELEFSRLIIEPSTEISLNARVIDVSGYKVNNQGKIIGRGHATRDAVLWSIPILWPIDLLTLPRRGPRPKLKEETRLTLKVMEDTTIPSIPGPQTEPGGLIHRGALSETPQVADPAPAAPMYAAVPAGVATEIAPIFLGPGYIMTASTDAAPSRPPAPVYYSRRAPPVARWVAPRSLAQVVPPSHDDAAQERRQ